MLVTQVFVAQRQSALATAAISDNHQLSGRLFSS